MPCTLISPLVAGSGAHPDLGAGCQKPASICDRCYNGGRGAISWGCARPSPGPVCADLTGGPRSIGPVAFTSLEICRASSASSRSNMAWHSTIKNWRLSHQAWMCWLVASSQAAGQEQAAGHGSQRKLTQHGPHSHSQQCHLREPPKVLDWSSHTSFSFSGSK